MKRMLLTLMALVVAASLQATGRTTAYRNKPQVDKTVTETISNMKGADETMVKATGTVVKGVTKEAIGWKTEELSQNIYVRF